MSKPDYEPRNAELRQKLQEAHNRFHGRFTTHAEVGKRSNWPEHVLEGVQIEDEELFYDEILALLAAQKQRWEVAARIDEDVQISRLMPSEDRLNWFIARLLVPHMNKLKADLAALDGELGKEQADV